jgi:dolichol-phosphate mannosyltransferase
MGSSNGISKFGLVIPTLNEAGNLPTLFDRIRAAMSSVEIPYELIVVDDDSQDGTADVVGKYSSTDPRVRLLVRKGQRGLAGAVIHGWQQTDADLLGVIDADLQHPPELLPVLIEGVCSGNDVAIASRYVKAKSTSGWSAARYAVSRLGTLVSMPLQRSGTRVKDPLSGFFVLRREGIDGLRLQPAGFKILLEILVRGRIKSAVEIPFQFGLRYAGKSKADVKVALDYFALLSRLSREAFFRPGSR